LVNPENPYQACTNKKLELYRSNRLETKNNSAERYEYSNIGIAILGYVLCNIESASYESLLQKYILSKNNMSNSTTNRAKVTGILVKGLNESGVQVPNWDLFTMAAAGAMLSTVEDLSKFSVAHFDGRNKELKLSRTKTFTINTISLYDLGWKIINRKSGAIWYKHNDGTGGYSSAIIIDTIEKKRPSYTFKFIHLQQ
jgi:CubicO group peptidase (beta-lactamase class C family)